jgi:hypothetical protein
VSADFGIACSGSNGSASLRSAAVPGMNCATPWAPAWLVTLGRKLLSCQISRVKKSTGKCCAVAAPSIMRHNA